MLKCIELDERLKAMDQEITVNPQFVQKVIRVPSLTRRGLDGDERAFRMRNVNWISGEMFNCQKFLKIFITKFTERLLRAFSTYGLEVCVGGCVGQTGNCLLFIVHRDYCAQSCRGTVLSEAWMRLALVETLDKGKCNYVHCLTLLQSMGSQEDDSGNKPSSYS